MPLLKYTTTIHTLKTVGEIQGILVANGAKSILIDYNDDGLAEALAFIIPTAHGDISFRLPINANAVLEILYQQRVIAASNRYDKDYAATEATPSSNRQAVEAVAKGHHRSEYRLLSGLPRWRKQGQGAHSSKRTQRPNERKGKEIDAPHQPASRTAVRRPEDWRDTTAGLT